MQSRLFSLKKKTRDTGLLKLMVRPSSTVFVFSNLLYKLKMHNSEGLPGVKPWYASTVNNVGKQVQLSSIGKKFHDKSGS